MVSRAAELAGKLLLEMKIFSPHSGPQKIGAGAREPAFYQALQVSLWYPYR